MRPAGAAPWGGWRALLGVQVTVAGWRVFLDARSPQLPGHQSTVIVERWWKVPLAGEGRKPLLHRRHRVYKLLEDTKHRPKDLLELILTQSVDGKPGPGC